MPLPRLLRKVNRVATNRVLGLLGGKVRPFATVIHVGRRSGRTYRTTVWAFRKGEAVAVALTYGTDVDWVRNALAAGSCRIELGGETLPIADPRVMSDEVGRSMMPVPIRAALSAMGVHHYLVGHVTTGLGS